MPPPPSQTKRLLVFVTVVLISFFLLKTLFYNEVAPPAPLTEEAVDPPQETRPHDKSSLERPSQSSIKKSQNSMFAGKIPVPPPQKSIAQIFESDDLCELERYLGQKQRDPNARSYQALAEDAYFNSSAFKKSYEEYGIAVSGMPGANTLHGRFLSSLRMANWLEGGPPFEGLIDLPRAVRDMIQLARDDQGNAAPAAFALAMHQTLTDTSDPKHSPPKKLSSVTTELEELLQQSVRFDSYQIGYLRDMVATDDSRVTALIMKISHLATLYVPNWSEFRLKFKEATESKNELRLHVADLMMKNSKEAKRPSKELGFNILESATARSIAGGARSYPSFKEIDDAFPNTRDSSPDTFELASAIASDGSCAPERVAKIRKYAHDLKNSTPGIGVAF